MPYLEIPERLDLRIWYCVNDLPKSGEDPPQPLDPAKKNLVLIHCATSASALSFSAQFADPRLTRAFNLIAFDARLHGRTRGGDRVTHVLQDSADCLIAALDKLGLESYNLLGEGFHGATICSWIAIKRPQKAQTLCLVSPGPLKEDYATSKALVEEWLPEAIANKDGNGDSSGSIPEDALQVISDYLFCRVNRQEDRRAAFMKAFQERYGTENASSHDLRHIAGFFRRDPIPSELLASIKTPVLIIHGEADKVASPLTATQAWQRSFKSARGGADLREIAGAPHLLMYTDYSIANRFLLAFVQRYA